MRCPSCDAHNPDDAPWCGLCHASLTAVAAPVPVAAAPVGRPVVRDEGPRHVPTYSRWRKSDTTFGPVGRVAWTVAVLMVCALALFSQDPFAIVPLCGIGAPLVLRSVWASGRVT